MGIEIYGWVEVKKHSWWTGVVKLDHLLDTRNRVAFECLFLADADTTLFEPLARERGFPNDASEEARGSFQDWGEAVKSPSWVTWSELSRMDWDEVAPGYHGYSRLFQPEADNALLPVPEGFDPEAELNVRGRRRVEWRDKFEPRFVIGYEKPTRREGIRAEQGWRCLMDMLHALANEYGGDAVRIVAWFV